LICQGNEKAIMYMDIIIIIIIIIMKKLLFILNISCEVCHIELVEAVLNFRSIFLSKVCTSWRLKTRYYSLVCK